MSLKKAVADIYRLFVIAFLVSFHSAILIISVTDTYKTLASESTGELKDRGSKFIAYATPLSIESDFMNFLEKIKKEHPKARHHCYAWRMGLDGNRYRANDDGEPQRYGRTPNFRAN